MRSFMNKEKGKGTTLSSPAPPPPSQLTVPISSAPAEGSSPLRADPEQFYNDVFHTLKTGSQRVALNIGGTKFVTTRDTLVQDELTYFAALLRHSRRASTGDLYKRNGNATGQLDEGLEYFIDRDPTHFRHILNYLRDCNVNVENRGHQDLQFMEELLVEAKFFNVRGLCETLANRIQEIAVKHKAEFSGDKDYRMVSCTQDKIAEVFHEWVIEKNYEMESMQQCMDGNVYIVLGRRVSRGELALVERLMKT